MKIPYMDKNFSKSTRIIIQQANEIIEEYMDDNLDLTLRQLYYQFVARDIIPNKQSEYKRLGSIINDARLTGDIDWYSIVDRTRNRKGNSHWTNPGQIIRSAARGFQLDRWEGQEIRPEVWIEKEALIGVIEGICRELDVDYFACKGYVSQSEMWSAAQRFERYREDDQNTVIIHLGDHDPSGMDMTNDIANRQHIFTGAHDIIRIALNMDQVEQYDPPPNPTKLTDSRAPGYIKDYGYDSWELDALEPRTLRDLISKTVLTYRDDEIFNQVMERETEYLRILKRVEDNWDTL